MTPTVVVIVVVLYPFYFASLGSMNILGDYPVLGTMVVMGVYAMMAVGLNIVVGYAGLLDLGYVAFYAMGAYTVAWFASVQFADHKLHFGAVGVGYEHARDPHLGVAAAAACRPAHGRRRRS